MKILYCCFKITVFRPKLLYVLSDGALSQYVGTGELLYFGAFSKLFIVQPLKLSCKYGIDRVSGNTGSTGYGSISTFINLLDRSDISYL